MSYFIEDYWQVQLSHILQYYVPFKPASYIHCHHLVSIQDVISDYFITGNHNNHLK